VKHGPKRDDGRLSQALGDQGAVDAAQRLSIEPSHLAPSRGCACHGDGVG
jgi:hypothetical protein